MIEKDLKLLINSFIPKLYSFSFYLIPDKLQAEQIVIDCITSFLVDLSENGKNKNDRSLEKINSKYIKINILHKIYKLSYKRSKHLSYTFEDKNYSILNSIDFRERAILVCSYILDLKHEEIFFALEINKEKLINSLHLIKIKLSKNNSSNYFNELDKNNCREKERVSHFLNNNNNQDFSKRYEQIIENHFSSCRKCNQLKFLHNEIISEVKYKCIVVNVDPEFKRKVNFELDLYFEERKLSHKEFSSLKAFQIKTYRNIQNTYQIFKELLLN